MFYSFNIFDVLLTRITATPRGIFAIMQHMLQKDKKFNRISAYIRNNFFDLRIHAEELARSNYQRDGIEEVDLVEIYNALANVGDVNNVDIASLIQLEYDVERLSIIGIDKNIKKVKQLFNQKKRVILLEDTSLDLVFMRNLLVDIDPVFEFIPIYLSSMYHKTQFSGNLYKYVLSNEGIVPSSWTHLASVCNCNDLFLEAIGVKVIRVKKSPFLPIEIDLLTTREDDYYVQVTIGTSRTVRMLEDINDACAIGECVAGPILFPYVQWILEQSKAYGIDRLYFIARDGYILKKIADVLIDKWKLPFSTKYIYGSRTAWRMPSYDGKKGSLQRLISWSYPHKIKTVRHLAKTLQVKVDDVVRFLPECYQNPDQEISYVSLCICIMRLEDQESFRKWLFCEMIFHRQLVNSYLQQEIDTHDDHFAFVELGGGGLTQSCLADLMADFYHGQVRSFFFKMDRINLMSNCVYYNFLPSKLKNELVIEMICRAPHGQTEGYQSGLQGIVLPVLKESEGTAIYEHGYEDYIKGIEQFAGFYAMIVKKYSMSVRIKNLLQYLEYIMNRPDPVLLDFFADMPNSLTGREKQVQVFAPKLTKKDIRNLYLWYPNDPVEQHYIGTDLEFSKLRCDEKSRKKIEFYQKNRENIIKRLERFIGREVEKKKSFSNQIEGISYSDFGEKIVLYGAGKYGREVYFSMQEANCKPVQWLDQAYRSIDLTGFPVDGDLSLLGHIQYDVILIAILSKTVAESIKRELIDKKGIDEKRIISLAHIVAYLNT